MFEGRYACTLDDKNRVSIPAKFREVLSANYDMTLKLTNLDGCIAAYPSREWQAIKEKISNFGAMRKEARAFLRYYYSSVTECQIDRLGRILIPQTLKTDADIKKNVMIVGIDKKIEIWALERWEDLVKRATADPDQVADIVSELGL
ncbi:MAG: division/cell wall cluster transcriptional repressor MraZ [Syntrophorhabdaceae bacterium]|nr:division/cell wall cluster transcriptional repressor MraZ [Syntrophorhabdaceae bacterium]